MFDLLIHCTDHCFAGQSPRLDDFWEKKLPADLATNDGLGFDGLGGWITAADGLDRIFFGEFPHLQTYPPSQLLHVPKTTPWVVKNIISIDTAIIRYPSFSGWLSRQIPIFDGGKPIFWPQRTKSIYWVVLYTLHFSIFSHCAAAEIWHVAGHLEAPWRSQRPHCEERLSWGWRRLRRGDCRLRKMLVIFWVMEQFDIDLYPPGLKLV